MCWIFHEALPIWLPIRCPLKKIVYASWKVFKICLRASKQWLILSASVRCFENFWSLGDVLICLLINTSAPSHWLKSVAWPVGPVLKFRDIPDCSGKKYFLLGHIDECHYVSTTALQSNASISMCNDTQSSINKHFIMSIYNTGWHFLQCKTTIGMTTKIYFKNVLCLLSFQIHSVFAKNR